MASIRHRLNDAAESSPSPDVVTLCGGSGNRFNMNMHYIGRYTFSARRSPGWPPQDSYRVVFLHTHMPTYVYQVINEDGSEGEIFEVFQKMSDAPLTTHPATGKPVRRVIVPPNIGGNWSDAATKSKLSDKNLDRLGF